MARHASSYRAGRRGMARADATGRALSDVWLDYRIGGEPRTRSNRFAPVISPPFEGHRIPKGYFRKKHRYQNPEWDHSEPHRARNRYGKRQPSKYVPHRGAKERGR